MERERQAGAENLHRAQLSLEGAWRREVGGDSTVHRSPRSPTVTSTGRTWGALRLPSLKPLPCLKVVLLKGRASSPLFSREIPSFFRSHWRRGDCCLGQGCQNWQIRIQNAHLNLNFKSHIIFSVSISQILHGI
ncbi:hypothetical protein HJG60_010985 [Phyllostomus discolor]|uniref:Uncharacterized protein n=1 Tax=Phyllostomus discolor TaxID=89673 RepID=A0A834A7D4_9CHIR|nr:hypothetical protein HJG60_010985 [Phyllostomus discolor]